MRDMDQLAAHARAQQIFQETLANVGDDQWDQPTPCTEWTVAALVDHIIGGNAWVQGLAGRQPVAVPDDDRIAAVAASAAGAHDVFAADDGLTRMFELPFGTMPGAGFIGMRTSDVLVHAWDLAKATGQSTHLDDELAGEALEAARMRLQPQMRGEGKPFGAEQPCPEGRPASDQLAAFVGRRVD
jgi:uncharacterized protein (TIGR03086 family)